MVALGMGSDLLQLDASASAHLEAYLLRAGGLEGATAGMPLGALTSSQVSHLELLAKLYTSRGNFSSSAQATSQHPFRGIAVASHFPPSLHLSCRHFLDLNRPSCAFQAAV